MVEVTVNVPARAVAVRSDKMVSKTKAKEAEELIASGQVDMICIGRGAMWDPRWAWHAAEELGAEAPYAPKTMPAHPSMRPQVFPNRAKSA